MPFSPLLFCCLLHALATTIGSVASFAPPNPSVAVLPRRSGTRSVAALGSADRLDDADDGNDEQREVETTTAGRNDDTAVDATPLQRARILSYRAAIGASALCISVMAINDVGVLEGTGANIEQLVQQSTSVWPLVSGAALLLCPVPKRAEIASISLGVATVISGLFSSFFPAGGGDVAPWSLSVISLMALSVREIWYFGGEYKQECGIILFMLPLMLDRDNIVPFAMPLCALGMSILAAGKVFEPCAEDLSRSKSEFLAK